MRFGSKKNCSFNDTAVTFMNKRASWVMLVYQNADLVDYIDNNYHKHYITSDMLKNIYITLFF